MKIPVFLVFICFLFLAPVVVAQQNVTSGTLSGRIEDTSGAVVSGANVTATNLETNQRLATITDHEGRYRFPYLRTGAYELTIEATGFSALTKQLILTVGQSLDMPVRLEVAGLSARVDVGNQLVFQLIDARIRREIQLWNWRIARRAAAAALRVTHESG